MSKDQKRQTLLQGFNTRNWTEAVFIIIVLQTLALSYQGRPIYSEPPYTIVATVYLPSISISFLSIFIFRLSETGQTIISHRKNAKTVQAYMHFMKK